MATKKIFLLSIAFSIVTLILIVTNSTINEQGPLPVPLIPIQFVVNKILKRDNALKSTKFIGAINTTLDKSNNSLNLGYVQETSDKNLFFIIGKITKVYSTDDDSKIHFTLLLSEYESTNVLLADKSISLPCTFQYQRTPELFPESINITTKQFWTTAGCFSEITPIKNQDIILSLRINISKIINSLKSESECNRKLIEKYRLTHKLQSPGCELYSNQIAVYSP